MAREHRTPDELLKAAEDAEDIASKLRDVAKLIENNPSLDSILVHGGAVLNHHLPKSWVWANSLKAEYDEQAKAADAGRMSKAEYDKQRHEVYSDPPSIALNKKKAAKKAAKKKTTKKKRK